MHTKDFVSTYFGPERRHGERRVYQDRRQMIRWEPENLDRRGRNNRRMIRQLDDVWDLNLGH